MLKRLRGFPGALVLVGALVALVLLAKYLWTKMNSVETDPTTQDQLSGLCAQYGVPVNLAKAIIQEESAWNPNACNPASSSNALASYGLMQVTAMIAQDAGYVVDWQNPTDAEIQSLYDPYTNMLIGLQDLAKCYQAFPDDINSAIQAYNLGITGVRSGKTNPGYLSNVLGYIQGYGGL